MHRQTNSQEEEEEEVYLLQPANKSDRMCHLVAMTMRSSCSSSLYNHDGNTTPIRRLSEVMHDGANWPTSAMIVLHHHLLHVHELWMLVQRTTLPFINPGIHNSTFYSKKVIPAQQCSAVSAARGAGSRFTLVQSLLEYFDRLPYSTLQAALQGAAGPYSTHAIQQSCILCQLQQYIACMHVHCMHACMHMPSHHLHAHSASHCS